MCIYLTTFVCPTCPLPSFAAGFNGFYKGYNFQFNLSWYLKNSYYCTHCNSKTQTKLVWRHKCQTICVDLNNNKNVGGMVVMSAVVII